MWTQNIKVLKVTEDRKKKQQDQLLIEKETEIIINGDVQASIIHSPQFEKELGIGYCLLQQPTQDILSCKYLQDKQQCVIETTEKSSNNEIRDSLAIIESAKIFQLTAYFQEKAYLYKKTAITESAAIATQDDIIYHFEDLHLDNAIYKLLGHAYQEGVKQLNEHILLVSAKLDSRLMKQLCNCNFEAIVSRTAFTKEALEIAKAQNINAIGFARGRRFNHYSSGI